MNNVVNKCLSHGQLILITLIITAIGLLGWAIADDFCNMQVVGESSVINYTLYLYLNWTGRFVTTFILGSTLKYIGLSHIKFIMAGLGFTFVSTCIIFIYTAFNNYSRQDKSIFSILFIVFMWIFMRSIIGESVYWATGGIVYLLPMLLLVMTKYLSDKLYAYSKNDKWKAVLFAFIWFSILGNGIELLVIPAFVMAAFLIWKNDGLKKSALPLSLSMMTGLAFGTATLLLAPGNFTRAAHGTAGFSINLSSVISNYLKIIVQLEHSFYSLSLYCLKLIIFLVALYAVFLLRNKKVWTLSGLMRDSGVQKLAAAIIMFLMAFAYALPLASVPDFITPRAYIYHVFFIAFSIFYLLAFLLDNKACLYCWNKSKLVLSVLSTIAFIAYTGPEIVKTYNIHKRMAELHEYNTTHKNEDVVLDPITEEIPKIIYFSYINADQNSWINVCVRDFYGLKSIKFKK